MLMREACRELGSLVERGKRGDRREWIRFLFSRTG